jgi:hypothetical protein
VRIGGILAILYKSNGKGSANFRDLYASRLILVATNYSYIRATKHYIRLKLTFLISFSFL